MKAEGKSSAAAPAAAAKMMTSMISAINERTSGWASPSALARSHSSFYSIQFTFIVKVNIAFLLPSLPKMKKEKRNPIVFVALIVYLMAVWVRLGWVGLVCAVATAIVAVLANITVAILIIIIIIVRVLLTYNS